MNWPHLCEDQMRSLCNLHGYTVQRLWKLPSAYWGGVLDYHRIQVCDWLVKTQYGLLEFKSRKRVVELDWSDTGYIATRSITKDDVTQDIRMVHAWNIFKLQEYMVTLKGRLDANQKEAEEAALEKTKGEYQE